MIINRLRRHARDTLDKILYHVFNYPILKRLLDMSVERHWRLKASGSPNPLLLQGNKYHSQNDEDGIISAIIDRIGLQDGVFVEFGCGDGLENNTLQLLMRGWRGLWVGAEELKISIPASTNRLRFEHAWVTEENCVDIIRRGLDHLGVANASLVSMDLDGNDWHFVQMILNAGFRPDIFVVEYNGKFPPPIRFTIKYNPTNSWTGSDYFGASLQSFVDLFHSFDFRLVCCNVTGANAFFVAGRHAHFFNDIPTLASDLFMPPDYNWLVKRGHTTDPRTVEIFLQTRN